MIVEANEEVDAILSNRAPDILRDEDSVVLASIAELNADRRGNIENRAQFDYLRIDGDSSVGNERNTRVPLAKWRFGDFEPYLSVDASIVRHDAPIPQLSASLDHDPVVERRAYTCECIRVSVAYDACISAYVERSVGFVDDLVE
jgi:hypothetical protein